MWTIEDLTEHLPKKSFLSVAKLDNRRTQPNWTKKPSTISQTECKSEITGNGQSEENMAWFFFI
jgi:hypothetical protein